MKQFEKSAYKFRENNHVQILPVSEMKISKNQYTRVVGSYQRATATK